jgi:hypothetical protein
MPQYITSLIENKWILIDAAEFGWIKEHGSGDNIWADIAPQPELERSLRLVYGCFLLNPAQVTGSLNPKSLSAMKGMEMVYIQSEWENGFYHWHSLKVIDIEILEHRLKTDPLAFAAIVDLVGEVPKTRNRSLSAFPYNSGLSVQQNITTRPGVLAINDEDRRLRWKLPDTHWRLLIDESRAQKAAHRVQRAVAERYKRGDFENYFRTRFGWPS